MWFRNVLSAVLLFFIALIVCTVVVLWIAGTAENRIVTTLLSGALVVSVFVFVVSRLVQMPVLNLSNALAMLLAIAAILMVTLAVVPFLKELPNVMVAAVEQMPVPELPLCLFGLLGVVLIVNPANRY